MALAVIAGGLKFDEALATIREREHDDAKPEARIAALRARYPDLASKVVEDELTIAAAEVEANQRDIKEQKLRETLIAVSVRAFDASAFAATDFVDSLMRRLDLPSFRDEFIARLQLDDPVNRNETIARWVAGCNKMAEVFSILQGRYDAKPQ
ncbi:MAG: hypothetical protein ACREDL_23905 [Bradyrhizobium sp.]